MSTNQLIIEHVSPFNVPVTVEKLIEVAKLKGWQNPAVHNLQQSLAKSGKDVLPVEVVEICKPDYSGSMLEKNDERIVSVLMPCRISVYEKNDGKTYVALLDMSQLTDGMTQTATKAVHAASDESFEIVKSVVGAF
ncbi:MAG: DUF302 domain-containing protein [Bacteroidetes bacterium]|nr:DUF302 domain-containing protein [Bacteroidota bacterium]